MHRVMADPNGNPSSKRLVTLVCTTLMAIGFIANLFWEFKMDEFIFNSVMYIIIGGMGITGVEKFAPKSPIDNTAE
jgi:hypothetical protein